MYMYILQLLDIHSVIETFFELAGTYSAIMSMAKTLKDTSFLFKIFSDKLLIISNKFVF